MHMQYSLAHRMHMNLVIRSEFAQLNMNAPLLIEQK